MSNNKLLKDTIIILIGNIGSKLLVFLLVPLYAKWLNTEEYGMYDTLISAASFLLPFLTLQLEQSIFNMGMKYKEKKGLFLKNSYIFTLVTVIVFSTIYISIQRNIIAICFAIYIILQCFQILSMEFIRSKELLKEYALTNIGILIMVFLFSFILSGHYKLGIVGLLGAYIISYFLFLLQFIARNTSVFKQCVNIDVLRQQIKFSVPLVPNAIGFWITNLSDRFAILYILGAYYNGIYAVATKFPAIITIFYSAFVLAWQAEAIRLINEKEKIVAIMKKVISVLFSSLFLVTPFVKYIIQIAFSAEYLDSILIAIVLMFATVYLCISQFITGILMAMSDTKIIGTSTMIAAIVNIVLNIVFLRNGLYVAAISTLVAYIVMLFIRIVYLCKFIQIKEIIKNILIYSLLALVFIPSFKSYNAIVDVSYVVMAILIFVLCNKDVLYKIKLRLSH